MQDRMQVWEVRQRELRLQVSSLLPSPSSSTPSYPSCMGNHDCRALEQEEQGQEVVAESMQEVGLKGRLEVGSECMQEVGLSR